MPNAYRRWLVSLFLCIGAGLTTLPALAAELLVIEDPRCGPCLLFDQQIGPLYSKTDEGRVAPLRRIAYGAAVPAPYAFIGPARTAPTFVLVDRGREVGRFEGYSGDELFWMNLTALMQKLPPQP